MKFLFLDDQRDPFNISWPVDLSNYQVIIARSHAEFAELIKKYGIPNVVSFDFDLCPEHYQEFGQSHQTSVHYRSKIPTGLVSAHLLVEECKKLKQKLPRWFVHSFNPVGKANIIRFLQNAEKTLTNS